MGKGNALCVCGSGKKQRKCCKRGGRAAAAAVSGRAARGACAPMVGVEVPLTMFEVEIAETRVTRIKRVRIAAPSREALEAALAGESELEMLFDEERTGDDDYVATHAATVESGPIDTLEYEPELFVTPAGTLDVVQWGSAGNTPVPYMDVASIEERVRFHEEHVARLRAQKGDAAADALVATNAKLIGWLRELLARAAN